MPSRWLEKPVITQCAIVGNGRIVIGIAARR
jgi:hypothetical protein